MTTKEKERLISELIAENQDACIRDYLEAVKEIEAVEMAISSIIHLT